MSLSFQVVRFVCKKKTIQQRLLCLNFLADPLTGNALAGQIIDVVMTQSGQHPQKLRFNTADGCATNGLANDVMKTIFPQCCDLICLSHSSNLPMKLFEKATPTANKFLQTWSQCLTQGSRVRSAFSSACGEKGLRSHAIRWMAQFREAVQVYARFKIVKVIVNSVEVGCESLMNTLRTIIDAPAGGKTSSITFHVEASTNSIFDIAHLNR